MLSDDMQTGFLKTSVTAAGAAGVLGLAVPLHTVLLPIFAGVQIDDRAAEVEMPRELPAAVGACWAIGSKSGRRVKWAAKC